MRFVLALMSLAACSLQATVDAQTAPKPWPREVQAVYDQLKQDCRAEGGKFVPDRAGFATQVEVTNDGKADWVIEYAATRCTTSGYSAWCGTAGCVIGILGSTKNGLREIFNDNVRGWDIISVDAKRKGLMLLTHGSVCGGYGAEVCGQTLVWNGQKWVQTGMQRNVDPSKMKGGDGAGEEENFTPPPQHTARWQFAGTGSGAIAAVTGHPEFAAIGIRCQPGGGLYMTVVPKAGVPLPAAGHPLLLSFRSSMEDREGTQTLVQEPGKGDFSGTIDPVVESLLSGRDTDLSLIASSDGGDEWKDLSYVSLGGSTAAIRALVPQCASAAGAASGAQAAGQKPVAPLGIVSGYYVDETEPCSNPGFEALYYDGKRLGLMRGGGAPGSLEENFVGPLGKVEKTRGSFFLPEWEMEVKILSPTRIQLTIQDTGPPMRWCPAEQIGAKWRLR
ncbi:hypothetical protein [Sphingopyxis sp. DBS4]|uniref:hypothetical protein n=1 Tax=Sphingopyxis sp. DBS4 TaxID=2968500 RepID=UPI00214BDBFF|nr:hypothetical protein [Sphingopyxis sp. DBS4]